MAARVSVIGALGGTELLSQRLLDCSTCVRTVFAALGHRPSRRVTLFLDGDIVRDDFVPGDGAVLEFAASFSEIAADERDALLRQLERCAEEVPVAQAYGSDQMQAEVTKRLMKLFDTPSPIEALFRSLPDAARDDVSIVLAAIRRDPDCLEFASEACRKDARVVLEAVRRGHASLRFAGDELRGDRSFVREAVRRMPDSLGFASEACRADPELREEAERLRLEALRGDPRLLGFLDEELRNSRAFVLEAVRANPRCFEFAGNACRKDEDIVFEAVLRAPSQLRFAGQACRRHPEILEAAMQGKRRRLFRKMSTGESETGAHPAKRLRTY